MYTLLSVDGRFVGRAFGVLQEGLFVPQMDS